MPTEPPGRHAQCHMRIYPATVILLLLAALTGCDPAADFEGAARTVAGARQASAERRHWTDGFVLLGHLSVWPRGRLPAGSVAARSTTPGPWRRPAGRDSRPGPLALGRRGHPDRAPDPGHHRLRRPHRAAHASPTRSARPRAAARCASPPVARGEATVRSSRGEVRVPTWTSPSRAWRSPFQRVAVDPSALGGPPRRRGSLQEVQTYEARVPTELQLSYLHGACDTTHGARVLRDAGGGRRGRGRAGRPHGDAGVPGHREDRHDRRHPAGAPRPPSGPGLQQRPALLPKSDLSRTGFVTFDARRS